MAERLQALLTPNTATNAHQPLAASAIYLLDHRCYLTVEGPEAVKFLQGQLSCNVQALSDTQAGIGSHSTPKGRMLSSFRLNRTDENTIALGLDCSICESALTALKKYIVFSKADIEQNTHCHVIGFHGAAAQAHFESKLGALPAAQYQQTQQNGLTITCVEANLPAWEVFGAEDELAALLDGIPADLIASAAQSTLVEQQAGLAFVTAETVEMFIPQMFNYQATPAISFTKGCYTGQEIVARMKYLGKMKRHMYAAQVTSSAPIQIADQLNISDEEQKQGNFTSAVQIGENRWQVLMILTDNAKAAEVLYHSNGAISDINYLPLPYDLDA